jgi:hypothetical protein
MLCFSTVIDENNNIFRIESPYDLNCIEIKSFGYIEKYTEPRNHLEFQGLDRYLWEE